MTAHHRTRLARLSPAGIAALGEPASSTPSKGAKNVITPGQVYVACDPRELGPDDKPRRIKVSYCNPGATRVEVMTLTAAGIPTRRRWMSAKYLHISVTTRTGAARKRGYVLETEAAR